MPLYQTYLVLDLSEESPNRTIAPIRSDLQRPLFGSLAAVV
jgi:hypothetical protein